MLLKTLKGGKTFFNLLSIQQEHLGIDLNILKEREWSLTSTVTGMTQRKVQKVYIAIREMQPKLYN